MKINPFSLLSKLRAILNRRQKQNSLILLVLFVLMALTQVVGVAAIFPFMNLVMEPTELANSRTLLFVYELFGFSSTDRFILFLWLAIFFFIVFYNFIFI